MALISAVLFMGALVPNVFVLAPRYLASVAYDAQQIGVVMSGFNIAALIAMPILGRVVERMGHRLVLIGGCLVAGAGALAFDLSTSLVAYTASRAAQGVGFSAVLIAAAAYVAEIAPIGRLAQALGISGVLTLASQAVGPSLGELLEYQVGWRWVFRSAAIGGVVGASLALLLPPADRRASQMGAAGRKPWPALCATALAGFGFGAVWTFLSDYVGTVTPFFVPYVAAAISTRVFLGHLSDVLGRRRVAVPALLAHGLALVALSAITQRWQLIAIGALFGLAHGVYYPTLQAMVLEGSAAARSRAIAQSTFAFGLGIVTAAVALGAVAKRTGYPTIYVVAAAVGAVAALSAWLGRPNPANTAGP